MPMTMYIPKSRVLWVRMTIYYYESENIMKKASNIFIYFLKINCEYPMLIDISNAQEDLKFYLKTKQTTKTKNKEDNNRSRVS